MFSAAQAADAIVTFTLTDSFITATDFIDIQHISATNGGAWNFSVVCAAGSCTITVRNVSNASIT
jgi:predicted FMN-binding regulatory protein PaiB